jgi:uncharacterized repeat protein (TIGR03803 family)
MNRLQTVSRVAAMLIVGASAALLLPTGASASAFTVLHKFNTGGQDSQTGLVNVGTHLYGTTTAGGAGQTGRVFKVSINGGNVEGVIHDFAANGSDGQNPQGALIKVGQYFYGTAHQGGNCLCGVLFKVHTNGTGYTILHYFGSDASDGYAPSGNLFYAGGFIYGTTQGGGAAGGWGTLFKLDVGTDTYSVFYSFAGGADGQLPYGGLIKVGSRLYGTTRDGGTSGQGYGTVFKIKSDGTAKQTLHVFAGPPSDGWSPLGQLVSFAGALYGTTFAGGQNSSGTVFKVDTANGSGYALLYSFGAAGDGAIPESALLPVYTVAGTPGLLYGTTANGGAFGIGTIYSVDASGNEAVVHSFAGNQGASPAAELINVVDGNGNNQLYGTAYNGGQYGYGTVFQYTP